MNLGVFDVAQKLRMVLSNLKQNVMPSIRKLINNTGHGRPPMRMNEQGKQAQPTPSTVAEPALAEKRDPSLDNFYKWINWFMRAEYGRQNPEISIYARVLARLRMIPVGDPAVCPMMAVSELKGHHVLLYNPKWMANAGYLEFVATLCHEALHILLLDIPKALNRIAMLPAEDRASYWRLMNVALDAANNDHLVEHHPHMRYGVTGEWILPEQVGLRRKQDMEHYFEVLCLRRQQMQKKVDEMREKYFSLVGAPTPGEGDPGNEGDPRPIPGIGGASQEELDQMSEGERLAYAMALLEALNAHDWTETKVEEQSAEELEAKASTLETEGRGIAAAAVASHQKQCGNVPTRFQGHLGGWEEGKLPWTKILSRLIKARLLGNKKPTENRPSKKKYIMFQKNEEGEVERLEMAFPIFPGSTRDRTFVVMYAIDTSGSMSDAEIMDGLGEIQSLLKQYPDVHCIVVQCDCDISDVSVLGPDEDLQHYVQRVGRASIGGTRFDPPFLLARAISGMSDWPTVPDAAVKIPELSKYDGVDLVVYHTDGYAPAPPIEVQPPCPTLWVLTEHGTAPGMKNGEGLFGTIIER